MTEKDTALVLIDIQKGFADEKFWGGNRNNLQAEEFASRLLDKCRTLNFPVFHIQHNSTSPTSPLKSNQEGNDIQDIVKPLPNERIIGKNVNSAFIGTNFKKQLDDLNIKKLILVGLTTNHCVSTTARMAGNLGYEVYISSDATATFNRVGMDGKVYDSELIHQISLVSLNEEFATVLTTEKLMQMLGK